jgi:hypothetical protein
MPIRPFPLERNRVTDAHSTFSCARKIVNSLSFWRRESRERAFPACKVYNYIVLLSNIMFNMVYIDKYVKFWHKI